MEQYHILVTVDNNYLLPLKVMLKSLFNNNFSLSFVIHLIYNDITKENLQDLQDYCAYHQANLQTYFITQETFMAAPTSERYSQAMYFRLLACKLLPDTLERILYLDPDILIINSIETLYNMPLKDNLFAAAIHTQLMPFADPVNKIRLGTYETEGYYNSGVMMLNLAKQREVIDEDAVFTYIQEHEKELILPDQDVLNGLYGSQILSIDDSLYNYDTRNFEAYLLWSGGVKTTRWVIQNTVVLHFCGKHKPWIKEAVTRFGILFKHYEQLVYRSAYTKKD
jgi:Lipopolysaccharide biosynthesis proteins, LPS:glycosyltransferases